MRPLHFLVARLRSNKAMQSLKALGILIALDDFRTDCSSLSCLEAFPFDRIKLDRAFVASLGRERAILAYCKAVIGLLHGLGVPILAEGIETQVRIRSCCTRAATKCRAI
jgi:EAL domain-containing protein (putative c-di-GMP-specific phosphodiesterase class I)